MLDKCHSGEIYEHYEHDIDLISIWNESIGLRRINRLELWVK